MFVWLKRSSLLGQRVNKAAKNGWRLVQVLRAFTKMEMDSTKSVVPFVPEDENGYHPGKNLGRGGGRLPQNYSQIYIGAP
jgi:hypothetical protein